MPTLYADNGSIRATIVSGVALTGLYAANGSINIVVDDDPSSLGGVYHSCGALRGTLVAVAGTTPVSYYASNGSTNFTVMPLRIPGILCITVVAGSLAMMDSSGVAASLDVNFTKNTSVLLNAVNTATSVVTISRASAGLAQNLSGEWLTFAAGEPRITDRGILIEEQRTNVLVNSSFTGAVVGTTNMGTGYTVSVGDGLVHQVTGAGIENGLDYVEIRFSGTTVVGGIACTLAPQAVTTIPAVYGQTWAATCFMKLISGTMNLGSPTIGLLAFRADGVTAVDNITSADLTPSFNTGQMFRAELVSTRTQSLTAYLQNRLLRFTTPTAGTAVDCTIRFYNPQVELAGANSQLASAVVVGGGAGYTVGDVLTVAGGSFVSAATMTVTAAPAGVISAVSMTTPGQYSVFPPSPASVTGGTGAGATFTLTPAIFVNNSGIATSPIRTSTVAVTRASDLAKFNGTNVTSWMDSTQVSARLQYTALPVYSATPVFTGFANDGAPSFSNVIYFSTGNTALNHNVSILSGGGSQFTNSLGTVAKGTGKVFSFGFKQDDFFAYNNDNGLSATDIIGLMPATTLTRISIGFAAWAGGGYYPNTYIERMTFWNTKLSNVNIQELGSRTV